MEGSYSIYQGNREIGAVEVVRRGLYLHFYCSCDRLPEGISRVVLRWGDREEILGVLVPKDGGFYLERRIAAKSLPVEVPEFLVRREGSVEGIFVPICPEEPFAYLHRLKDAYLVRKGGEMGVMLSTTPIVKSL